MGRLAVLLAFFFFTGNVKATTAYFEFSPLAEKAYLSATSLKFEESKKWINELKSQESGNLIFHHIEDYIDFFTLFIGEEEKEFNLRKNNRDLRLTAISKGDPSSPYYLYLQANIRLHWALVRLKFEEYFQAFLETRKAFRLLSKNAELFPGFFPNQKDLGILHAMVGTIPDQYKWGLEILGISGSIKQGEQELKWVLENTNRSSFIYYDETVILYTYLLLHLNNEQDEAWSILSKSISDVGNNPLLCFTMANLAMRTGQNEKAIHLLKNRPKGNQFFPFPYLDFMLGQCYLRKISPEAEVYFYRFLAHFTGRHFIKEAYQKLAWFELIFRGKSGYHQNLKKLLKAGYLVVASDKDAQQEANRATPPLLLLLKARLLFDGGYYQRALALLESKNNEEFSVHNSEYYYRLGRICQKLGSEDRAMKYYSMIIESGLTSKEYFPCNAALQSGLIAEKNHDMINAKKYYTLVLQMKPAMHRIGLHQQAKAGLNRISNLTNK